MADDKYFYADPDSEYGEGVLLDEYNGKYSLVSARESKTGEIFMQWCFPQARDGSKKPIDKSVPWKVTPGDKDAMVKMLQYFLDVLMPGGSNEQIPF